MKFKQTASALLAAALIAGTAFMLPAQAITPTGGGKDRNRCAV